MAGIDFKKFKFFLSTTLTRQSISGDGFEELENSPDGWEDMQINFTRSEMYKGLLRQFSFPLKFVRRGALIVRSEMYKRLIAANIAFMAQRFQQDFSYKAFFTGKVDISKTDDNVTDVTAPIIPNDFSANVDAYDSIKYAISLDDPKAINLELPPIALNETATFLMPGQTLIVDHGAFFELQVVDNQQNSVDKSVQSVKEDSTAGPNFGTSIKWFYKATTTGKINISGNFTYGSFNEDPDPSPITLRNQANVTLREFPNGSFNFVLNVNKGDRLFLYLKPGQTFGGHGEIDLAYKTISPGSMCKAYRASDLLGKLLKAMNNNTDSAANLPVPYKSALLTGPLRNLVITCSDSIRAGVGSLYQAGDTIFPGIYRVINGTVTYNGNNYGVGGEFAFDDVATTFDSVDNGIIQRIQSIFIGNIFNAGESLQAGGTYLVQGDAGQFARYNGQVVDVGSSFKYVLGQDTFIGSNDTVFVKETALDPIIQTNFQDFFQAMLSVQGGDASFGNEKQSDGSFIAYLETLGFVFRKGINAYGLGIIDDTAKFQIATDLLFNSLKCGYEDQQYDVNNGNQEVNSTQYWQTALLVPKKELNLISPYRADPLGIELLRIQQSDSAASRSNNDVFMVWIKSAPEPITYELPPLSAHPFFVYYHPLRSEGLISITGVDPSYYNWKLTPKQNLTRGGRYLSSVFYGLQGYMITQTSALKNAGVVTIDTGGVRVAEDDPISISDLPDPYFIPVYANAKAGLSAELLDLIDNTPYSDLNFTTLGKNYKAFLYNFALQIGNETPQDLKLLLTPDNNLLDLVH